jgi:hypothetical protein
MRYSTQRLGSPGFRSLKRLSLLSASALLLAVPALSLAQAATTPAPAPARETPRPQEIDPAVDTSRPGTSESAPARETPRPQDIDPGVDTSATAPTNTAPSATAPSGINASPSGKAATRKPSPSNGASGANGAAGAAGTAQPGGATRTQGRGKGKALDRLELDTTQITGNRELPKVLYIVPWKRADLGDLVGKPVNSLLDEVLAPVDRDVFKRENRYYHALMPEGSQPASGQASGPASTTSTSSPNAPSASGNAAPPAKDER